MYSVYFLRAACVCLLRTSCLSAAAVHAMRLSAGNIRASVCATIKPILKPTTALKRGLPAVAAKIEKL
jgi:hypothetical protein